MEVKVSIAISVTDPESFIGSTEGERAVRMFYASLTNVDVEMVRVRLSLQVRRLADEERRLTDEERRLTDVLVKASVTIDAVGDSSAESSEISTDIYQRVTTVTPLEISTGLNNALVDAGRPDWAEVAVVDQFENDDQDCEWGPWGAWGMCSNPCAGGFRVRSRGIASPAVNGGEPCSDANSQMQSCNLQACPYCATGQFLEITAESASCELCPLGTYMSSTFIANSRGVVDGRLVQRSFCSPCAAGSYAASLGTVYCDLCESGRYGVVEEADNEDVCLPCRKGKFSGVAGATACTSCSPGSYADMESQLECIACGVGRYSTTIGGKENTCRDCPKGRASAAEVAPRCTPCPRGWYSNNERSTECRPCARGKYNNNEGADDQSFCIDCPLGRASDVLGAATCSACARGKYSDYLGLTACSECGVSTYSDMEGATTPSLCRKCPTGRFSTVGAGPDLSACQLCERGTFADDLSLTACTACPRGFVAPELGAADCEECEAGTIATSSVLPCRKCPEGYFSGEDGLEVCSPCAEGTYADVSGSSQCKDCDRGRFSNISGTSSCYLCAEGKFASEPESLECNLCKPGTFSGKGAEECTECAKGSYVNVSGAAGCVLCEAGRFASDTGQESCDACPVGRYSDEEGQSTCRMCSLGRFAEEPGTLSCTECRSGTYAASRGMATCAQCDPGQFSSKAASECNLCNVGKVSRTAGSGECMPCGPGEFANEIGMSDCLACAPGSATPSWGMAACSPCTRGRASPKVGALDCDDCLPGQFADSAGQTACGVCPPGKISLGKAEVCQMCDNGKFAAGSGSSACNNCGPGTFSTDDKTTECAACPRGTYNPNNGSNNPGSCRECSRGRYNPNEGESFCRTCPAGYYGADVGATNQSETCLICPGGTYSSTDGQGECDICGAGNYSLEGSMFCSVCPPGRFGAEPRSSTCSRCSGGLYRSVDMAPTECAECPLGRYSPDSEVDSFDVCLMCPGGTYGFTRGASSQASGCKACAAGTYSSPSLDECIKCEPGTYSGVQAPRCETCPAGRFQDDRGASNCDVCEKGRYREANSAVATICEDCPKGKYQPVKEAKSIESCIDCPGGTRGPLKATESEDFCIECMPGRHAAPGSSNCSVCQAGTSSGLRAVSCVPCASGRFAENAQQSSCDACPIGTFHDFTAPGSDGRVCELCPAGRFSTVEAAGSVTACQACEVGRFGSFAGASACEVCSADTFAIAEGLTACTACKPGSSTPRGAVSCCPRHNDDAWPVTPAGSLYTSPGRSETPIHVLTSCDGEVPKARAVVSTPINALPRPEQDTTGSLALATLTSADPREAAIHECVDWTCGEACLAIVKADSELFVPGQGVKVIAFVRTNPQGTNSEVISLNKDLGMALNDVRNSSSASDGANNSDGANSNVATASDGSFFWQNNFYQLCDNEASLLLAGFGCEPNTLSIFLLSLTFVVMFTVVLGLLLELVQRSRQIVFVESRFEVQVPEGAPVPTKKMLRENISRRLAGSAELAKLKLTPQDFPKERFGAWLIRSPAAAGMVTLHVEYGILSPPTKHQELKRKLKQVTWIPAIEDPSWANAKTFVQPPTLVKAAGRAPGMDLIAMMERIALVCLGGVEDEDKDQRDLHKAVARDLLRCLTSRRACLLLSLQYVMNLAAAGLLPMWAYFEMESCVAGYPSLVHAVWGGYIMVSGLCSVCLVRLAGGPSAKKFLSNFRWRVLLRLLFMTVMLTDTYQDATFPVIANVCGFDLWFVSAWLVMLGVGVMQICAQVFILAYCVWKYERARTPEERERLVVQGAFLAMRGSDNLVLVYAVRPAVEERLGGASSWAMKTSEARIAFFRFLFEDVEQSALQGVFLFFYEDAATSDRIWVSLSIATSLLLSFTLVVQCLPEVRDWMWYRILPQFPGGRSFWPLRAPWLLACLACYRALSAFPWVSACSPQGEPCKEVDGVVWWRTGCINGKSVLFGLPARFEVVREVAVSSAMSVAGIFGSVVVATIFWWVWSICSRRRNKWNENEEYSLKRRFCMRSELLRPKTSEDDDLWLEAARELHAIAITSPKPEVEGGAVAGRGDRANLSVQRLVEAIDESTYNLVRRPLRWPTLIFHGRGELPRRIEDLGKSAQLKALGSHAVAKAKTLVHEVMRTQHIMEVTRATQRLLSDKSFIKADLERKSSRIHEATMGRAPLLFISWDTIEALEHLPKCGVPGGAETINEILSRMSKRLGVTPARAARHVVPFFLSHRWLRTRGPRANHHPDSDTQVKARGLVAFAKWFIGLASERGLKCEVVFWIDWCCCDQDDLEQTEVGIAALPLYIASCMKVVAWRTSDFDRRCWTMVERVLAYSFCAGGLMPYVIDENFVAIDQPEEEVGSARLSVPSKRHGKNSKDAPVQQSPRPLDVIGEDDIPPEYPMRKPARDPSSALVQVTTQSAKRGDRVARGTDWMYGDQDGGIGSVGTIIEIGVCDVCTVRWDSGAVETYRTGPEGEHDLDHVCAPSHDSLDVEGHSDSVAVVAEIGDVTSDSARIESVARIDSAASSSDSCVGVASMRGEMAGVMPDAPSAEDGVMFDARSAEDGAISARSKRPSAASVASGVSVASLGTTPEAYRDHHEHMFGPFASLPRASSWHRGAPSRGAAKSVSSVVHRRARKLPNPLDFETCQVTRVSDRRCVAQLVDIALAVPALEVYPDRQPVEWGLTEIIEQSLSNRGPLPRTWEAKSEEPPATWFEPMASGSAEWRLVVEDATQVQGVTPRREETDAIVWMDYGFKPTTAAPTPERLEELFRKVDNAVDEGMPTENAIRELIIGLKSTFREAMSVGNHDAMEAAIHAARDVDLPEKQTALDAICQSNLEAALATGIESEMRTALRDASANAADHLEIFKRVYEEQQRLYKENLARNVRARFDVALAEDDFMLLVAVHRVAKKHDMLEIVDAARKSCEELVRQAHAAGLFEELVEMRRVAEDIKFVELAQVVAGSLEDLTMSKALEKAAASDNIAAMRAVEQRALECGKTQIAEKATLLAQECATRLGDKWGLPAEWDVVLELAGPNMKPSRLKKSEETQGALIERIQNLMDETYMAWGGLGKATRTRDRAKDPIADRLEVMSVVYVQNAENYINFVTRRAAISLQVPNDLKTDWNIKTARVPLTGAGRHRENPVDYSINEHYLWHGTTPKGAVGITDKDFDLKRAGTAYGALFGGGLYFAESALKADEYTKQDHRGWYPMILCRVVLGNIFYCGVHDPTKMRTELVAACKPGGPGFHSVLGDREKVRRTFREFIVYDNHQVYPEYIVWYRRKT